VFGNVFAVNVISPKTRSVTMKNVLLLIAAICFMMVFVVQAQIIANFDVEGLGTQGFVDNGWGAGLTGVQRIADPTGRSAGVLAVDFDGSKDWRGVFEKPSFSPKNAHIVSFMVYLPANFPDSGVVQLFGQDNQHWAHTTDTYYGVDLAKGKWIVVNYDIYSRYLTIPGTLDPYSPNMFGRWGVQLQAGPGDTNYDNTFVGRVLFDDLTLVGDEPKVISNFEVEGLGLDGWFSPNWGPGLAADGLQRVADPSGESAAVLGVSMDAALGTRATLEKDGVSIADDNHVIAVKIWVPTGFPDDAYVQIVGQDDIYWAWHPQQYLGSTLTKDQWNEIYYDVLSMYTIDKSTFDPYTNHRWGKLIIDIDNNTSWTGTLYIDDIVYLGPAPPPTAELASPPITTTAGVSSLTDPFTGKVLYYNQIQWTDISADIGESYNLYCCESGPITDVTAPGVVQLSTQIPRGVQVFNHRIYTVNGETKTYYYAMTATGLDETQSVVETPVREGISNSGAVTAPTSRLFEIPLVESFNFVPDAYLDEFEELAKTFTRSLLRTETVGELHAAEWDTSSVDLNFKAYVVMDMDNLYMGMEVIDDNTTGNGQAWEGDGFDVYGGLYDITNLTSLFKGTDAPGAGLGGYRVGAAINASGTDQLQTLGYSPWAPEGGEYVQDVLDHGYYLEFKIPFAAMDAKFGSQFTPADGMLLPLKIDVNDNDGAGDNPGGGNNRSLQCHWGDSPSNFNSWQRTEAWGAPVIVTTNPLPTAVESADSPVPYTFSLSQNYPNPFNPSTTVEYQLAHTTNVSIVVYDVLGKEIRTLVDGKKKAGLYTVSWDGTDNAGSRVSSGVYFYKMAALGYTKIQKMMLLK
jgi:hypothetical protein